jgi:hypothetical protein
MRLIITGVYSTKRAAPNKKKAASAILVALNAFASNDLLTVFDGGAEHVVGFVARIFVETWVKPATKKRRSEASE